MRTLLNVFLAYQYLNKKNYDYITCYGNIVEKINLYCGVFLNGPHNGLDFRLCRLFLQRGRAWVIKKVRTIGTELFCSPKHCLL